MALLVRVIHWNADEAAERAERVRRAGYDVDASPFTQRSLAAMRRRSPAAVLISLERLPMQGRDVGIALRHAAATRRVPLLFVGGEPDKRERVRAQLPDAAFTTWRGVRGALRRATTGPPAEPVVPPSVLAGYSGTPLPQKLGIKAGAVVALVGAPPRFERMLGGLPAGAALRSGLRGGYNLILWFTRSRRELSAKIRSMARCVGPGGLWILWPKQASGVATDLTQTAVRNAGLANGLVDYKVCAVDATWSGLKFARRKAHR